MEKTTWECDFDFWLSKRYSAWRQVFPPVERGRPTSSDMHACSHTSFWPMINLWLFQCTRTVRTFRYGQFPLVVALFLPQKPQRPLAGVKKGGANRNNNFTFCILCKMKIFWEICHCLPFCMFSLPILQIFIGMIVKLLLCQPFWTS